MGIDHPSAPVIDAIESAIAWFQKTRIEGIRWIPKPAPTEPGHFDRVVVHDTAAPPLWARFYEIGTDRPIFSGRDGIVKYDVAEIESERRNGYRWYVDNPAELLQKDYPAWRRLWRQ
jgi:PelA/Pel-15E family pectate lyase